MKQQEIIREIKKLREDLEDLRKILDNRTLAIMKHFALIKENEYKKKRKQVSKRSK